MAAFDVVPNSEHLIQRATELLFSVRPRPSGESIHLLRSDLPGTSQCSKRMQRVFAKSCSPLLVTFSHKGGAGVSDRRMEMTFLSCLPRMLWQTGLCPGHRSLNLHLRHLHFFSLPPIAVTLSLLNCMFPLRFYLNLYF